MPAVTIFIPIRAPPLIGCHLILHSAGIDARLASHLSYALSSVHCPDPNVVAIYAKLVCVPSRHYRRQDGVVNVI